jgi:hypothetical protein
VHGSYYLYRHSGGPQRRCVVATGIAKGGESAPVDAYDSARPRLSGTSATLIVLDAYRGVEGVIHY